MAIEGAPAQSSVGRYAPAGLAAGIGRALEPLARRWGHDQTLFSWLRRVSLWLYRLSPKGLYTRSILIIVTPIIILQAVLAFVFMDRHWEQVTQRLSAALSRDIAALIEIYEQLPAEDSATLTRIAEQHLDLRVSFLPKTTLPRREEPAFFDILDNILTSELKSRTRRPFWIDTLRESNLVEVRVALDNSVLRIQARRSQAYASNSHIFLLWMFGTALVLITIAVLFLRNQIKPIQRLAEAADNFGKGRNVPDFRPRGAREVRQASLAFIRMKDRIERHVEQRTTMLAGVSHDLKTILTRFRLELALLGDGAATADLGRDVDEMQNMLDAYLAFARGGSGETTVKTDLADLLLELKIDAARAGFEVSLSLEAPLTAEVRPNAFKRLMGNLIGNAGRHARFVAVSARRTPTLLEVFVDDDGPGIPKARRDEVFRPFHRLDPARNQDVGSTGLGLTIARDIARGHGGDVTLDDSPLGGLRAVVRLPI